MQDLAVVALIKATKATGVEFLHCNAHEAAQPSISCSSKSSRQSRMTQRCRCHCNGSLGKPQSIPLTVVLVQQYKASLSQHVSHPAERAHLLYMFNTTSLPSPLSKLKSWIFRMTMFLSHKPSILFISFKNFSLLVSMEFGSLLHVLINVCFCLHRHLVAKFPERISCV